MNILENLISKNIISRADASKIERQAEELDKSVEEILEDVGVPTQALLDIKGSYYNVPVMNLANYAVSPNSLKYISEDSANIIKWFLFLLKMGVLEVGMTDPDNIEARDALNFIVSKLSIPIKYM
jgi:hypothetical protein